MIPPVSPRAVERRQEGILEECLFLQKSHRRQLLRVLDSDEGREVLEELERHFEVDLPVFQGKSGSFDPLDAMRRDAYREVFLYLRYQLNLARRERELFPEPMEEEATPGMPSVPIINNNQL